MDQELINAGTQNMNLPHDLVTLPSGGIYYKSKKKVVKVGYLTASDENIIASALSNPSSNIITTLIRSKLYEPELKVEELLDGDIEAILIFLRNTSFGHEYFFSITDTKTSKKFESSILLDELNIKKTEVTPDENGHLTTILPRSGDTIKLKLMSYGEQRELESIINQYPVGRTVPSITLRLNKEIVSVNGNEDKIFISTYVEKLPIMDSKHIRKFLNNNNPGLDLKRTVRTPSGEMVDINITFGVEFFRPFF